MPTLFIFQHLAFKQTSPYSVAVVAVQLPVSDPANGHTPPTFEILSCQLLDKGKPIPNDAFYPEYYDFMWVGNDQHAHFEHMPAVGNTFRVQSTPCYDAGTSMISLTS